MRSNHLTIQKLVETITVASTPAEIDRAYKAAYHQAKDAGLLDSAAHTTLAEASRRAHLKLTEEVKKVKNPRNSKPQSEGRVLDYYKDGKLMNASNNSLSSLAYQATATIGGPDVKRISTADLVDLLAKSGVTDPRGHPFKVTLPNGHVIEARKVGAAAPVANGAAKKAPVKSAAPVSKAAPSKVGRSRRTSEVTPITKESQTRRRSTRKSA